MCSSQRISSAFLPEVHGRIPQWLLLASYNHLDMFGPLWHFSVCLFARLERLIRLFVSIIHRPALSRQHAGASSKCGYHGHPSFRAYKDYLDVFVSVPSDPIKLQALQIHQSQGSSNASLSRPCLWLCILTEQPGRWKTGFATHTGLFCVLFCLSHRRTIFLNCVPVSRSPWALHGFKRLGVFVCHPYWSSSGVHRIVRPPRSERQTHPYLLSSRCLRASLPHCPASYVHVHSYKPSIRPVPGVTHV